MVEHVLRPAREAEALQIKDLIHLVGINPMGLDWKRFVVAVNAQGQVIACGQIKPHGKDIHEMASIAVTPQYRGQGLARAVIEELLRISSRPLYLMCISHNGPMYEKFGFRIVAYERMPRYFQRMNTLFNAMNAFSRADGKLLVMKLE